jgi:hypothetical protein
MRLGWNCCWNVKHVRDGAIIWEFDHSNILVAEGGKAIVDSVFRNNASVYFVDTDFYVGMYKGSVSKSTVLATIPGEPTGNGYARVQCERSEVGWPTIELDESGDWRVVSKELTFTAAGGNIGPVDGAFLGTSLTNFGALIGSVAFGVQRTILAGDSVIAQLRAKIR